MAIAPCSAAETEQSRGDLNGVRPGLTAALLHVLGINTHKWEYKIGEEVRAWLNETLQVWLEEEPEWFTPQHKCLIPDRFIYDRALLLKIWTPNVVKIISERRRSSVGLLPGATGDLSGLAVKKEERGEKEEETRKVYALAHLERPLSTVKAIEFNNI